MKKYLFASLSFIIGLGCFIAYRIIGSEIAPDGTLIEPFFLIPMGYLFFAIGIMIVLVVSVVSLYRKIKKTDK